ncbi:MAG: sigma-54 dependent transcriptional regulator [Planctomycetaceae bacterium]
MPVLLVIDDNRTVSHMVTSAFEKEGVDVLSAQTASEGVELVRNSKPDTVLLDIVLPNVSGLEVFREIHSIDAKLPVIFITAGGTSETAIEAMKLGAYDYLLKPLNLPKLKELVRSALDTRHRMQVPVGLAAGDFEAGPGDVFVGRSDSALEVYKAIGRVAPQDVTVLIRGESGTGKELVARAIYQHSTRSSGPFMAVNCAAIADSLLESELFGHEKGAFTGADNRRIGKFEQCSGGTIFLDEVGDTSPLLQSKMLRLLQQQEFERVGGNQTIKTDVRIIAATNRPLEDMVEAGTFRTDLLYRLNVFTVEIPPLRERPDDILLLIEYFLGKFKKELGHPELEGMAPEAVDLLQRYEWPGNVRELQSIVRKSILNSAGPVIVIKDLPAETRDDHRRGGHAAAPDGPDGAADSDLRPFVERRIADGTEELYAEALEKMERYLITRVLEQTDGNQSQASRMLGITRGSLRNKIRSLGIRINQVVLSDADE